MAAPVEMVADLRLFDYGAEGYCTDVGQTVYDILADTHANGWISTYAYGDTALPTLQFIDALGCMIPRVRIVRQDAAAANWILSDADAWHFDAASVHENKTWLRLNKYDPYGSETATTNWSFPQQTDLAFDLIVQPPVRSEYDANKQAPYVFATFGNRLWGIVYGVDDACRLVRWSGDTGNYETALELSPQQEQMGIIDMTKAAVLPFLVLNYRGYIAVSVDRGQSFDVVGDGTDVLEEGPLQVHFYGLCGGLALHQTYQTMGEYRVAKIPLFEDRSTVRVKSRNRVGRHYFNPASMDGTDPPARYVFLNQLPTWPRAGETFSYLARLTPKAVAQPGAPWTCYDAPCLVATEWDYPAKVAAPTNIYTQLADTEKVEQVTVQLPNDLDGGTVDIDISLDPNDTLAGEFRRRYLQVSLGVKFDDDTVVSNAVMCCYITNVKTTGGAGWGAGGHKFKLRGLDASYAGKKTAGSVVDEAWRPLDGMGLNNALTYCAKKIGIHPARMSWYADDGFILPYGPADDPAWWRTGDIRLGMAVWDVMTMIAGLVGYDLFVAPNGVWTTYPYSYDTGVAWAFDAGPAPADAWLSAREVEYEAETMLAATAVMATGEDASGLHTGAWLIDRQRESNTATNMFAGRRQWKRITGRRFLDTATAMGTATEEFDRQQETHYMLYWKSLPQLGAARGDAVTMAGAAMDGVPAGVDHLVESIIHTIGPYPIGSHTSFKAKRV